MGVARKEYWDTYRLVTSSKSMDWATECEYRLVISNSMLCDYSEVKSRVVQYRFEDLEAIVFMKDFISNYLCARERFAFSKRLYFAFSVIGCKGCISDVDKYGSVSRVDRNVVINTPIQLEDALNEDTVAEAIELFCDDFLLSLGVHDLTKKDVDMF